MTLQNEVALVTGSTSEIGRATARYLLAIAFLHHSNA
jgi:NAD(P)-dependent dehydrogenase (short-subunit alcohol dehydrogenase family)